jgi:hypothetical protein
VQYPHALLHILISLVQSYHIEPGSCLIEQKLEMMGNGRGGDGLRWAKVGEGGRRWMGGAEEGETIGDKVLVEGNERSLSP